MPTYCYRIDGTNELHEEIWSIAEKALREGKGGKITLRDGRTATRDMVAEQGFQTHSDSGWPINSDAMAVSPTQISTATEHARARGVLTDFDRKGRPILTSPAHRKRYMKSRGFFDRDGFL